VGALLQIDRSVAENVFRRATKELLRVLVPESVDVVIDARSGELLLEGDLLELHLMDAGCGGADEGRESGSGLHSGRLEAFSMQRPPWGYFEDG
jgi:hypothetical protein